MVKKLPYIALLICCMLLLAGCNAARTPQKSAKNFFEAIEVSDYQRAVEFTTLNPEEDLELYYAIMQKQQASIAEKGGIQSVKIVSENRSAETPDKAIVVVVINYKDGSTQEECCNMTLHDKKWLLDVNLSSK